MKTINYLIVETIGKEITGITQANAIVVFKNGLAKEFAIEDAHVENKKVIFEFVAGIGVAEIHMSDRMFVEINGVLKELHFKHCIKISDENISCNMQV